MKVQMFEALVSRGMETKIPVTFPRHENMILSKVHGVENLTLLNDKQPVGEFEIESVNEERYRLERKYSAALVSSVFPTNEILNKAIQDAAVPDSEGASDEGVPVEKMTVVELRNVLEQNGIAYDEKAKKPDLLELVKAHATDL